MKQKILSVGLSLLMMMVTVIPQGPVFALDNSVSQIEEKTATQPVLDDLLRQSADKYKLSDSLTIIVTIQDKVIESKYGLKAPELTQIKNPDVLSAQIEYANLARHHVLSRFDELGIDYKVTETYDTVLCGMAVMCSFADAQKIARLDEVQSLEINRVLPAPKVAPTIMYKTMYTSDSNHQMIHANKAWLKNFTGKGQLIAIIDSGADPYHEIFDDFNSSGAKIMGSGQIEDGVKNKAISPGKYYSDKIPFGFNYAERNTVIKQMGDMSHGMHVAGIIAANGVQGKIKGVAPDAQLAIMRVFGGGLFGGGTTPEIYNKAIDDAVKLGADSINMSLGSSATTDSRLEVSTLNALKNASNAGILVAIAAGNDGFMGFPALSGPDADNPNYGMINSPAVADISMCVASVDNTQVIQKGILIQNDPINKAIAFEATDDKPTSSEYLPYVYVGKGYPEDYQKNLANTVSTSNTTLVSDIQSKSVTDSVTTQAALSIKSPQVSGQRISQSTTSAAITLDGKYALIERGEKENATKDFNFYDKVKIAQEHGAEGVIVFNHLEETTLTHMAGLDVSSIKIPSFFISKTDGQRILANKDAKLKVSSKEQVIANPNGYALSNFSSWGMSEEGNLKPDISAPGGKIYSSINNQKYKVLSGTSMATPHVCGGIAIVKEYVEKTYPEVLDSEKRQLIKNVMMSTAVPHQFKQNVECYGSPRGQGAGLMNLEAAIKADVVIKGTNGVSSFNLRNIEGDTVTISGELKNYGNTDRHFKYHAVLSSDEVKEGHITLNPERLKVSAEREITVPAQKSVPFTVTLELESSQIKALEDTMPNGFFLEGYVFFTNQDGSEKTSISAPFVGFKGVSGVSKWEDLKVIEDSIYAFAKTDRRPMYYGFAKKIKAPFTHLASLVEGSLVVLGEKVSSTLESPAYTDRFAFSPNEDGNADTIMFIGTFLRNYKDFKLNIYSAEDTNQSISLYSTDSDDNFGLKNFYSNNPMTGPNLTQTKDYWAWNGLKKNGEEAADGQYTLNVVVKPDGMSQQVQTMSFPITIDRVAPRIAKSSYDKSSRKFKLIQVEETGSGIREQKIVYEGQQYDPDDTNTFTLGANVDVEKAMLEITDYAYNTLSVPVSKAVRTGTERMVLVKSVLQSGVMPKDSFTWKIFDKNGVEADPYNLSIGHYKLVINVKDTNYELKDGKSEIDVEITPDDYVKEINVNFKRAGKAQIRVIVNSVPNASFRLFAINQDNAKEYELATILSGLNPRYECFVEPGDYKVVLRGLDQSNYIAVGTKTISVNDNDDSLNNVITIKNRKNDTGTITLNRGNYKGALKVTLVGRDIFGTTLAVDFGANETVKEISVPRYIPFDIYTSNYTQPNYGSDIIKHEFKLNARAVTIDVIKGAQSQDVVVDKSLLGIYLKQAFALSENDYVLSTWETFEAIVYQAQLVYRDKNATKTAVDLATNQVYKAKFELKLKGQGATKEDLYRKIKEAEAIYSNLDERYTNKSKDFLIIAIEGAKLTYHSNDPKYGTSKHIESTINMLERAIRNLSKVDGSVDKSNLEFLAQKANAVLMEKTKYKDNYMNDLEALYQDVQELIKDATASKEEVHRYEDLLKATLAKISAKSDKQKLQALVESCEKIKLFEYELKQRSAFRAALNNAKSILKNNKAMQGDIDAALAKLSAMQKSLVKMNEDTSSDSEDKNNSAKKAGDKDGSSKKSPDKKNEKKSNSSGTTHGSSNAPIRSSDKGSAAKSDASKKAMVLQEPIKYSDVSETHWAISAINFVSQNGYFKGVSTNTFEPERAITRAEFITVLGRIAKINSLDYSALPFNDVKADQFYAPSVNWAYTMRIADGVGDKKFEPNRVITRQEMAVMLIRFIDLQQMEIKGSNAKIFTDDNQIAPWAKDAVKRLSALDIVSGMPDGRFAPKDQLSRAQVAQVLNNLSK